MAARMEFGFIFLIISVMIPLLVIGGLILAVVLLVRWSNRQHAETAQSSEIRKTLAEVLKEHRTRCGMTQEYVAEALGISRQAVSKWELGASEPSTTNLLALAKLYGTTPEELLSALTKKSQV